jgi:SEC-C motif-containing protein
MSFKAPKKCPCGNGLYRKCCGRFHPLFAGEATAVPRDAEQLMRSRYSAFALAMPEYLLSTWHASTRPAELDLSDSPRWLKLDIYSVAQQGTAAQVHFCAYFEFDGEVGEHEELSEFVREDGRWFYIRPLQTAS